MKYFLDIEFIEGFHKPLFGKRRHFIDLISIGIVAEDGREYYAISTDFNPKDANYWVKKNVLDKLEPKKIWMDKYHHGGYMGYNPIWRPNAIITADLIEFFRVGIDQSIEIYTYYGAYDHVVLCALFGTMIMLPQGMPMFTRDLMQMAVESGLPNFPNHGDDEHNALADAKWNQKLYNDIVEWKAAKPSAQ